MLNSTSASAEGSLRIEGVHPLFGRDVNPDNLPQEVARDARTINFVKGCYLGQETVARIDALGHVNKILRLHSSFTAARIRHSPCRLKDRGRGQDSRYDHLVGLFA